MRFKKQLALLTTFTIICSLFPSSAGLAVMSVDLGSEYLKVAIVKPGVPMEIVLNRESSRKSPTVVAMRDGERLFSDAALQTGVKFPRKAFWYLTHLLGKKFDDPEVTLYRERFPYYELVEDESTGMFTFKTENDIEYSPEELLAMILEIAREDAETFAEQPIKDAVITVPAFFNQAERRAIVRSAELVGLNVLQLMSNNAAVALNYGIFRRKEFNSTMQYYIFYDMGSSSTTASVVGYQMVKTKEGTIMETNPQLSIKGVGFDKNLGGLEITLRLQRHLAKLFNEQKKTKTDVFTNERAMGKLFKEATRVKKVLSANTEHFAQVEGLLEEKDFRTKVTRAELDELCTDLFDRVTKPIQDALKTSEITMGEITDVILMGAGSRVPKVQEKLLEFLGRKDLGKSINTDEAAALGAVYQAAHLSKGFRVKKFTVKEGNIYPIVVQFERQTFSEDGTPSIKLVNRTLFGHMNPFPQKKVMTFNKHYKDFPFWVRYGKADMLSEETQSSLGTGDLQKVKLSGVEDSYEKNSKGAESKGVKAHFRMDESGILLLDKVEFVFEKQPDPEEEKMDESAWSKIGSAIGGLFGGAEKEKGKSTVKEGSVDGKPSTNDKESGTQTDNNNMTEEDTGKNATDESETGSKSTSGKEESTEKSETGDTKPETDETKPETDETKPETDETIPDETDSEKSESESDETKPEDEKEEADKKEESGDTKKTEEESKDKDKKSEGEKEGKNEKSDKKGDGKDGAKKDEKDKKEEKEEEPKKPKIVTIRDELKAKTKNLDLKDPSEDHIKLSKERLAELKKKDQERQLLQKAKNELESFIFESQDKLSQEEYIKCSTEEERKGLMTKLSEAGDWQYEQEDDAGKEIFMEKRKSLKTDLNDLFTRVRERRNRPKAVEELRAAVTQAKNFSTSIRNITKMETEMFTTIEMDTLDKLLNETEEWLNTTLKQQEETAAHEAPVLTKSVIMEKGKAVAREVQYLISKMLSYQQRAKTKPKESSNNTANGNKTTTIDSNATKTDEGTDETATDNTVEDEIPAPPTGEDSDQGEQPQTDEQSQSTKDEEEILQIGERDAEDKARSEDKAKSEEKDTAKTEKSKTVEEPIESDQKVEKSSEKKTDKTKKSEKSANTKEDDKKTDDEKNHDPGEL